MIPGVEIKLGDKTFTVAPMNFKTLIKVSPLMKSFEHALRYVAIAGAFALPFVVLFVAQSLFFPFITGKNFAFRIIVEIMVTAAK